MDDIVGGGMAEATRLTRAGRLVEATEAIQRRLQGGGGGGAAGTGTPVAAPLPRRFGRLRETLSALPQGPGGTISGSIPDRQLSEVWAGGQFIEGSCTNEAGTRTYKLYVPSGYRGQALPSVVMLHGCTQSPDDFAAGTRMNLLAERELFFVVYPAQAVAANQSRCWNWFKTSDQHRDRGEPALIAGITRQVCSSYSVDTRRVYVAGLSAGGAMAAIMGANYSDLFAAIGVHSGLAYGAAHDLPSALAVMQKGRAGAAPAQDARVGAIKAPGRIVPTIVFHGDRDTTVHPRNAEEVLAQWEAIGSESGSGAAAGKTRLRMIVERGQVPGGCGYTRSCYHDGSGDAGGDAIMERWLLHGVGHAWSGGGPNGSFTDPKGPDASEEMVRFFLARSS